MINQEENKEADGVEVIKKSQLLERVHSIKD